MSLLVFLEHHDGALSPGRSACSPKQPRSIPTSPRCSSATTSSRRSPREAGRYGAATVFTVVDAFPSPLPGPRIDVLAELVRGRGFDTVLFSNSVLAADVAAGLAARLDAGINWDLVDLELRDGEPVGRQPMLQDSVVAEVGWRSPQRIALFRPGSFEAVPSAAEREPTVESLTVAFAEHTLAARVVERTLRADEGPSLADADVIVAGGIGLGSRGGLRARRAARGGARRRGRCDARRGLQGLVPAVGADRPDRQDGLAEALRRARDLRRGAAQGRMQNSKTIVAVNKDPHAPIFEFSDLAVVGDVHTVVPELIELLRKHAG